MKNAMERLVETERNYLILKAMADGFADAARGHWWGASIWWMCAGRLAGVVPAAVYDKWNAMLAERFGKPPAMPWEEEEEVQDA